MSVVAQASIQNVPVDADAWIVEQSLFHSLAI